MFEKLCHLYSHLLDEALENHTLLVAMIAGIVLAAGLLVPVHAQGDMSLEANILQSSQQTQTPILIEIEGVTYEMILKKR